MNALKVNGQEVPQFNLELAEVKILTAESLVDCAFDPIVKNQILQGLPENSARILNGLTKQTSTRELA
jgi:hypothetical protein